MPASSRPDYASNLDYTLPLLGGLDGTLAFGSQGYWDITSMSMSTGRGFAGEGVTTVSGGALNFGGETFAEDINIGAFVQNRFDFDDLFITTAVRIDGNSAFGVNYGFQVYPKGRCGLQPERRHAPWPRQQRQVAGRRGNGR